MMGDGMEKLRNGDRALDAERRLMNEALGRLNKSRTRIGAEDRRIERYAAGRLIFGLDLTWSRETGLKRARVATAAMFDAIKTIGRIEMKLVYYRGTGECRESQWCADADVLCRSMLGLSCESGGTQIAKLLRLVLRTTGQLSGLIFIGDCCEEDADELEALAEKLGERAIPLFMFHECTDYERRSLDAKPLFKRLAKLTGGAYVEFRPDSAEVLRELLSHVAAFSAAGAEGVGRMALPMTAEARQLRSRLLLGAGADPNETR